MLRQKSQCTLKNLEVSRWTAINKSYRRKQITWLKHWGMVTGEVLLKRQYKIRNSRLVHFFDCSIVIKDGILQEILSRNASPQMRNIVETIQKEQDLIIRDTDNELLIVQGVAGSGWRPNPWATGSQWKPGPGNWNR